jgi:hypothetical protein
VPSKVNGINGNHHVMSGAGSNVAVAVRAQVGLGGLVRLQETNLYVTELGGIEH